MLEKSKEATVSTRRNRDTEKGKGGGDRNTSLLVKELGRES